MQREKFGSRLGFLLLSAGCAIGIGNVWRFPYVVGQNGGGAFVLLYLLFLAAVGVPVLTMEFAIGRASKKSCVAAYQVLEPKGSKWHWHGKVAMLGNYVLMAFYTTVAGWMFYYFYRFLTGQLSGLDTAGVGGAFNSMLGRPGTMALWMLIIVAAGFAVCSLGLQTHQGVSYEVSTNLVALYNIYNLLGAIAGICESGIALEEILPLVSNLHQIEGRMERIDEGQPFTVIVDFAHTPDGLEKIFEYAKDITKQGRSIIAVFGSAGKRDTKKRKVFGEVASRFCDNIILTEDDPRDEDPREIANEIKSGITNTNHIFIENRYDAIRQAIESANVGDTVLILGKGDEIFMYREFGREPWLGDHIAARHCIRKYYLGIEVEDS